MREKKLQCVITFKTTTQAMAFEEVAKNAALKGRLIPLPRVISAGCGLAWRTDVEERAQVEDIILKQGLTYDEIHEVII